MRCPDEAQRIYEEGMRLFEAIKVDQHHIEANLSLSSALHFLDPVEQAKQIFFKTNNVLAVDAENMGWYRKLVARKFNGDKSRRYPGFPRIDDEIEQWVVRKAKENSDGGCDRIVGAMASYPRRRGSVQQYGQTSYARTCLFLRG